MSFIHSAVSMRKNETLYKQKNWNRTIIVISMFDQLQHGSLFRQKRQCEICFCFCFHNLVLPNSRHSDSCKTFAKKRLLSGTLLSLQLETQLLQFSQVCVERRMSSCGKSNYKQVDLHYFLYQICISAWCCWRFLTADSKWITAHSLTLKKTVHILLMLNNLSNKVVRFSSLLQRDIIFSSGQNCTVLMEPHQ